MNRILITLAAIAVATTTSALAGSNFTGTWKGEVESAQLSKKPTIYLISGGNYSCTTCVPAVTVPADGKFHPVKGNPYYDQMSVTLVDANTVKRATTKAGKPASESMITIAADGKTAAYTFTDMTATNGVPVTGKGTDQRVAAGPAGAHAMSGSWIPTATGTVSESGLTFMVAMDGDMVEFKTPTGAAFKAKVDGTIAPVTGDPGWTTVSVKRTGPNTLVETDFRDGKPIATYKMTVSADGKRMTTEFEDLLRGRKSTYFANKQ